MRYDALVIGAGMSGLAAGLRLAQFGLRVAVLERHYLWGGLNSYYRQAGRRIDSGLHALTNWAPRGARGRPLTRILRQLRIPHDELRLGEQLGSEIRMGGARLEFTNDFAVLRDSVAAAFPAEAERFDRLAADLAERPLDPSGRPARSARAMLSERLRDPLLVDALLLPACYYGSARANDVDEEQFTILFHSIFLEGLARPDGGVKRLLDALVRRLRAAGAELRMRSGVARIVHEAGVARGVVLDDGTELEADRVLSSAGWVETLRLCGTDVAASLAPADEGTLSFLEAVSIGSLKPAELGCRTTTAFFCDSERFEYAPPDELADPRSGVISLPNNFEGQSELDEGWTRVSLLAHPTRWGTLGREQYLREKERWSERALDVASRYVPDPRPHELHRDTFTPLTIRRFTGRVNGAVYGSPTKHPDGTTPLRRLYVCGTDQGLLGVVGAMLSGITIANRHALRGAATA